ncbi:unnamed protein product [Arctogadus glacialis]
MVTISEPDPGLSEEPEDTSLDREETRKRRFDLCLPITLIVSLGLLIILTISLRLSSVMPTEEEEEAPSITEFHSSTHVLPVGQTARCTCHAGGTPEPTVEWLHNGRPLERNGTDNKSEAWVERGFLFVRGVRYGVNTVCCMASNSAGTANHSAELLVFDACELTLDPNTAHRRLSLSEDNRKVTRVREDQSYPDHPERFDSWRQVLGREALTGRCYWESGSVVGAAAGWNLQEGEEQSAGGAVSGLAVGERCEDSGLLSECGTVLRTWASTGTVLPAGGSKVRPILQLVAHPNLMVGLGVGEVGCKCLDGVRGNSGERVVYGGVLVVARSSEVEVHLVGGFLTGGSGGEGGDG